MEKFLAALLPEGSVAYAMAATPREGGDQSSFLLQMVPFFLVFAIIYFLMIRPQQKRQQEHRSMLASLKAGDSVLAGGIYGEITRIKDDVVHLKVADNVRIRVHKSVISAKTASEEKPQGSS